MKQITEDNLILDEVCEEKIEKVITEYYLTFKREEIIVTRIQGDNDTYMDSTDEWGFKSNLNLNNEDKVIIRDFCLSQN